MIASPINLREETGAWHYEETKIVDIFVPCKYQKSVGMDMMASIVHVRTYRDFVEPKQKLGRR